MTALRLVAVRRCAAVALITAGSAGLWGWAVAACVLGLALLVPDARRAPGAQP